MKDNYQFKNKMLVLIGGLTSILLASCGTYQAATYEDDGIYSSDQRTIASNETVVVKNNANAKYYEEYFGKTVTDYGEIVDDEVFTDVDNYSSQNVVTQDAEVAVESYSAWEDADDNITINVYNTRPYYYSYWRPYNYWNDYYYNGWSFCGPLWGWSNNYYWHHGYYGNYGYYGNPYYYNNYGNRHTRYANGRRRGYASNAYYGRNISRRGVAARRTTGRAIIPRSTPRATPRSVPRSTPRATPRSVPRNTPRATPRSVPRSTPRATPRSVPRSTPRATPRRTPRSTPRATPRSMPRSTPRSAPRTTPRSTPRSSSSRRGRL